METNDFKKPIMKTDVYPFLFCVNCNPRLTEDMDWEYDEAHYIKAFGVDHFDAQEKVVQDAMEKYGPKYANGVIQWEVLFPVSTPENIYIETLR